MSMDWFLVEKWRLAGDLHALQILDQPRYAMRYLGRAIRARGKLFVTWSNPSCL